MIRPMSIGLTAVCSSLHPVQALFDRIGLSGKERLRDELHETIEDRFGMGPIRMTNVATIGSGSAT